MKRFCDRISQTLDWRTGVQVTRNHPPVKDVDAVDHDTMHPGIWLGFGDISGQDFWRNKATMEHLRFVKAPTTADGQLRFATECRLKTSSGEPLCSADERLHVDRAAEWLAAGVERRVPCRSA